MQKIASVLVIFIGAGLFLGGCSPTQTTYMQPSASAGELRRWHGSCGGPYEEIVFHPESLRQVGLVLRAIPSQSPHNSRVSINIEIYKDTDYIRDKIGLSPFVTFWNEKEHESKKRAYTTIVDEPIQITAPDNTVRLSWDGATKGNYSAKLDFLDARNSSVLSNKTIMRTILIPNFSGSTLYLALPPLMFNGHPLNIPVITFFLKTDVFVTGINC